jgi:HAD superfamily hydrolase (TIGR01509 family)
MYTHLYSLPTAFEVAGHDLEGPVPPVEAVLFDFANTLFRMVPLDVFLSRIWQAAGRDPAELDAAAVARAVQAAAELPHVRAAQEGRDTAPARHREASRVWFSEVPQFADIFDLVYEAIVDRGSWFAYEDTAPVLRELAARGVPVGIVSDIVWDVRRDLEAIGVAHTVNAFALSYQLGYEKPDPRMFLKTCAELGADPRRTVMVGDNPVRDGGATACGLRTLLMPAEPRTGERGLRAVLSLLTA